MSDKRPKRDRGKEMREHHSKHQKIAEKIKNRIAGQRRRGGNFELDVTDLVSDAYVDKNLINEMIAKARSQHKVIIYQADGGKWRTRLDSDTA